MHEHVRLIWTAMKADLEQGKVIDVDRYCRSLAAVFPELTRRQIRDTVLELVGICGGGAVWGTEPETPGTGPDGGVKEQDQPTGARSQ